MSLSGVLQDGRRPGGKSFGLLVFDGPANRSGRQPVRSWSLMLP